MSAWLEFRAKVPADVMPLIREELDRLKRIAEIAPHPPIVADGRALELMAALSAQTPEESLR